MLTSGVVVHLADLGAYRDQFLVGLDTCQGLGLFVGVGADVLSLAETVLILDRQLTAGGK